MVKICVVGCVHGEMINMYNDIHETELKYNFKIDIVLCCGDFESIRNNADLTVMAAPLKYRVMGDFWKYYAGESIAPYLTVFVGGNHEASNYLQELPYGGWVAPNIYYLGYAGVVNFHGLRIAGMSGIYNSQDYNSGHHEHAPYTEQSLHSAYYVRSIETFRLKQIRSPVDIVLSHDWPTGIERYSNKLRQLLKRKPYIVDGDCGNPVAEEILWHLKPRYWFSAHHHVKLSSSVQFRDTNTSVTRFLALDKCLPGNHYLQILDIDPVGSDHNVNQQLSLDPEWLCILRATNHLMSISKLSSVLPTEKDGTKFDFTTSEKDLAEVAILFDNQFVVPENFIATGPRHYDEYLSLWNNLVTVDIFTNPQTDSICAKLSLLNPNKLFLDDKWWMDDLIAKGRRCTLQDSNNEVKVKERNLETIMNKEETKENPDEHQ